MAPQPKLSSNILDRLADILSAFDTGSNILSLLAQVSYSNPYLNGSKKSKLYQAFEDMQNKDQYSNRILAYIEKTLDPVRFYDDPEKYSQLSGAINTILSFVGYEITKSGKICTVIKATTIDEAHQRSSRLREKMYSRNMHNEVIKYCKPELLQHNYFHAVLEASKGILERVRDMSGVELDGTKLIEYVFSSKNPKIAINKLQNETEQNEHGGLRSLLLGIVMLIRNPMSHEPKIKWAIEEIDALDVLSMISFVHRQLDKAFKTSL